MSDESLRARGLHSLGRLALAHGDATTALRATEESLAIARGQGNQSVLIPEALHQLGWIHHWQGDAERARSALEESLARTQGLGDERQVADILSDLADLLRLQGDRARARDLYRQSLVLTTKLDDPTGTAANEASLGQILLAEGDLVQAEPLLKGALITYKSLHNRLSAVVCIAGLGVVAAHRHHPLRAVRLLAAADGLLTSMNTQMDPADRVDFERSLQLASSELSQVAFSFAWAEGRTLSLEQATDAAFTSDATSEAGGIARSHDSKVPIGT